MGDSSDDILLQINHVKYKKDDGQLCIASNKIGWIKENTQNFAVSIIYTDIKTQKISPETKPKVQLQLILNDQSNHVFHFVHPQGKEKQTAERNTVKDKLSQLLSAARRAPRDDMLEKKRVLEEQPQLKRLYMELVKGGLLQPEQFWSDIAGSYRKTLPPTLDLGVSGAFLVDIKPQTDANNGKVMYNLTPDNRLAIFRTYPSVKKKHLDYVPAKMSEAEFWTRFFQSHYYSAHTTSRSEEVFQECAKSDDREWGKDLARATGDPLLCLDNVYEGTAFGATEAAKSKAGSNHMHATMIRRFNQHSQNILKGQSQREEEKRYDQLLAKEVSGATNGEVLPEPDQPKPKRARLEEKLEYGDLAAPERRGEARLELQETHRYLAGPPAPPRPALPRPAPAPASAPALRTALLTWRPDLTAPQASASAYRLLAGLGEACRRRGGAEALEPLPPALQRELSAVYGSACELLRHFWSCFPPGRSPELLQKLHTLHAALLSYRASALTPLQDKAVRDYNCRPGLLEHLVAMFHTATAKYDSWKARNGVRTS